jgi:hypothetical protein
MKWINIKDELPEDVCDVLCYLEGRDEIMLLAYYPMLDSIREDFEFLDSDGYMYDVTHWMPLPTPPKESE